MNVRNPLEANDWDFASFFVLIASLQVLVWVLLGLDAVGLRVPILREVLVLTYLLFVPGILLLRILKVHELDHIECLLYTVGLSVATVMLTGFFMNAVYLHFIPRPISLVPFIATMTALVATLLLLSYRRDREFSHPKVTDVSWISSPVPVALCLLPFVGIFGRCCACCRVRLYVMGASTLLWARYFCSSRRPAASQLPHYELRLGK
jgi:uncharacterized membrane protein